MLIPGRVPLTEAETSAIEQLIADHPDEPISLTRRDPGESGPVLVHIGDITYSVSEDGLVEEGQAI